MRKGKRFRKRKRPVMLLVSLALVLSVAVGGTVAFLVHQSETVKNVFSVAEVPITVIEDSFTGSKKENVKIKHTGDSDDRAAYVRATIVANWVNDAGEVYGQQPVKGVDYTISMDPERNWTNLGDYWYYKKPILPQNETSELIDTCSPVANKAPTGYYLSIEILAQSIQADGVASNGTTRPIEDAWGVSVVVDNDGNITSITEKSNN